MTCGGQRGVGEAAIPGAWEARQCSSWSAGAALQPVWSSAKNYNLVSRRDRDGCERLATATACDSDSGDRQPYDAPPGSRRDSAWPASSSPLPRTTCTSRLPFSPTHPLRCVFCTSIRPSRRHGPPTRALDGLDHLRVRRARPGALLALDTLPNANMTRRSSEACMTTSRRSFCSGQAAVASTRSPACFIRAVI